MNDILKRGFAILTAERRREIASMGGRAVPASARTFSTDKELAKRAGAKGGTNIPAEKRSFSRDRKLASRAGRKGGRALSAIATKR